MIIDAAIDPTPSQTMLGAIIDQDWNMVTLYFDGETIEDACTNHLFRHFALMSSDPDKIKQTLKEMPPEKKIGIVNDRVRRGEATIFQRLTGHDRARWELFGRKKKINSPILLTDIERASDIDRDDVILWKQFLGDTRPGKFVYAGVVFYDEPDTRENDPDWTPRERARLKPSQKLGKPRRLR